MTPTQQEALEDTEQSLEQGVAVGDDNARVLAQIIRQQAQEIAELAKAAKAALDYIEGVGAQWPDDLDKHLRDALTKHQAKDAK